MPRAAVTLAPDEPGRTPIDIRHEDDIEPALLEDLDLWFRTQFSHTQFIWSQRPWRVMARDGDDLVGHIGLVTRTVCVDEREVFVAGVGGVMTREAWRGRGVATAMLNASAGFMRDRLGAEFGLLLCRPEVERVYAKSGWRTVEGPTFFDQPSGRAQYPRLTMILPLAATRGWPSARSISADCPGELSSNAASVRRDHLRREHRLSSPLRHCRYTARWYGGTSPRAYVSDGRSNAAASV